MERRIHITKFQEPYRVPRDERIEGEQAVATDVDDIDFSPVLERSFTDASKEALGEVSDGRTSPSSESDEQIEFKFEVIQDGVPETHCFRVRSERGCFSAFHVAVGMHRRYQATKEKIILWGFIEVCKQALARRRSRKLKPDSRLQLLLVSVIQEEYSMLQDEQLLRAGINEIEEAISEASQESAFPLEGAHYIISNIYLIKYHLHKEKKDIDKAVEHHRTAVTLIRNRSGDVRQLQPAGFEQDDDESTRAGLILRQSSMGLIRALCGRYVASGDTTHLREFVQECNTSTTLLNREDPNFLSTAQRFCEIPEYCRNNKNLRDVRDNYIALCWAQQELKRHPKPKSLPSAPPLTSLADMLG